MRLGAGSANKADNVFICAQCWSQAPKLSDPPQVLFISLWVQQQLFASCKQQLLDATRVRLTQTQVGLFTKREGGRRRFCLAVGETPADGF